MKLVFVFSAIWAMAYLQVSRLWIHLPAYEEPAIAVHLAKGEGFLSPMDKSPRAPQTAWSPPAYPYVVAATYRIFGIETPAAAGALGVFNATCFATTAACIFQIASSILSEAAGFIALALLWLHPILLRYVGDYWDGCMGMALFFLAVALADHWSRTRITLARAAMLGAVLGLLSLSNASYALSYPLIILIAVWREPARRRLEMIGLAFLAWLLVLLPWTARNYKEFDRLIYVRAGAPLELWTGNRPNLTGWMSPQVFDQHPSRNVIERKSLLRLGETKYFRLCQDRFDEACRNNPAEFWLRTVRRIIYLFIGEPWTRAPMPFLPGIRTKSGLYIARFVVNGFVTIFGLAGVWTMRRARLRAAWMFGASMLAVAPFFITSAGDRYALPLRAMLVLFTGLLAGAIIHYARHRRWPGVPSIDPLSNAAH